MPKSGYSKVVPRYVRAYQKFIGVTVIIAWLILITALVAVYGSDVMQSIQTFSARWYA